MRTAKLACEHLTVVGMSTLAFVHALYSTIDSRTWEQLSEFFDPAIVYLRPGYAPLCGLPSVQRFYEHERVIAAGTHHVTSVVVGDGAAAAFGRFVGTHRNGHSLDEEFADHFAFGDGLIVRRQSYFFRPAV